MATVYAENPDSTAREKLIQVASVSEARRVETEFWENARWDKINPLVQQVVPTSDTPRQYLVGVLLETLPDQEAQRVIDLLGLTLDEENAALLRMPGRVYQGTLSARDIVSLANCGWVAAITAI